MYKLESAIAEVNSESNYTDTRGADGAQNLINSPEAGMVAHRHKPTAPIRIHACAIAD